MPNDPELAALLRSTTTTDAEKWEAIASYFDPAPAPVVKSRPGWTASAVTEYVDEIPVALEEAFKNANRIEWSSAGLSENAMRDQFDKVSSEAISKLAGSETDFAGKKIIVSVSGAEKRPEDTEDPTSFSISVQEEAIT